MLSYPIASIDLAALKHNLSLVKQQAPKSKVLSVIKANAYGHGSVEVARALTETDAFAVARLDEGITLRQAGIQHDIVLLEGVHSTEQLLQASRYQLSPVFHHFSQLALIESAVLEQPLTFCWMMLNSGMHRLGFRPSDVQQAYERLTHSQNISGEIGLMSHFANADIKNDPRTQQQLDIIQNVGKQLGHLTLNLANSAAVLSLTGTQTEWVRPGLMLYGISPFDDVSAHDLGLKPVMKLTAQLISIDEVEVGEQVGYGGDWQALKPTRIGTVNIGYGDGYNRHLSSCGQVVISGTKVDVLGRVSMDMICIDLSTVDDAQVGQEVALWGDGQLAVETVAQQAKTIAYELVCQVSPRVKRIYING